MTKERPVLMSAPMVRAILDGRKTVTRRAMRTNHVGYRAFYRWDGEPFRRAMMRCLNETEPGSSVFCEDNRFGVPDERLWVITILPLVGHEGRYGAGDDGHIYRTDRPEPRALRESSAAGYRRVSLSLGSKRAHVMSTVHEAVCAAFYGPRPSPRHEVRHLNGNRTDNTPSNLDWGTPEENWSDRKAHGKGIHESHHNAKLSMASAEAMRASGKTAWALAKEYSVSAKTVSNVLNGRTWVKGSPAPVNMPRWASRITLEIVDVRVERLHEVTEEDAAREGVERLDGLWRNYMAPTEPAPLVSDAVGSFASLWERINGPGSWASNPWVWRVEFRRVEA